MQATRRLLQQRQPMIKFVGQRHAIPQKIDHAPRLHPASPADSLPESFASYREQATQHGPLKGSGGQQSQSSPTSASSTSSSTAAAAAAPQSPYGQIGGKSAKELGPIRPGKGEFADRSELPQRFHRTPWSAAEIEAIESGGASMFA